MSQVTSAPGGGHPRTPHICSAKIDNPVDYSVAIYHFNAQIISRSSGKSSTAAAAYRARDKVYDERTGLNFDYSYKDSANHCQILAPNHAQEWVYNREVLWNKVEAAERRKDSQLAREINIALPVELSREEKIELGLSFVKNQYVSQGMVADVAFHDLDSHNPHFHVMLTTRQLEGEGFALTKEKAWRPDFAYGQAKSDLLVQERSSWQDYANAALERAGKTERIDHRTLLAQGLEHIPQIHLGAKVAAMEKKGISTTVGDEYRQIDQANAELATLQIRLNINRYQSESEKELEKLRIQKQREEEQKQQEERKKKEQERQLERQFQKPNEVQEVALKAVKKYNPDTTEFDKNTENKQLNLPPNIGERLINLMEQPQMVEVQRGGHLIHDGQSYLIIFQPADQKISIKDKQSNKILITENKLQPKTTQNDLNKLDKFITYAENILQINSQQKTKQNRNINRDKGKGRRRGR